MLPLRFPRFWASVGWLLVAAVVTSSLLPARLLPALQASDKVAHAVSYLLLMVWFAGLYARRRHAWIAAALLAGGIVVELLQAGTRSRTFDTADILANASGILTGLALAFWLLAGWCQRLERLLHAPQ